MSEFNSLVALFIKMAGTKITYMVCAPIMAAVSCGENPKLVRKNVNISFVPILAEQISGLGPCVMSAASQAWRPIVLNGIDTNAVCGMAISTPV